MSYTQVQLRNLYQADISTLSAGTELINRPCIVYEITITSDAAGDANVSFADKAGTYTNATRVTKVKTTDENQTVQVTYPKGKNFLLGLCAKSNLASVDVSVTFE